MSHIGIPQQEYRNIIWGVFFCNLLFQLDKMWYDNKI